MCNFTNQISWTTLFLKLTEKYGNRTTNYIVSDSRLSGGYNRDLTQDFNLDQSNSSRNKTVSEKIITGSNYQGILEKGLLDFVIFYEFYCLPTLFWDTLYK